MPVLDTNFLIALQDGDEAAVALLERHREEPLYVPDVVAAEFLTDWPETEDRETILAAIEQDFTLCYNDRRWVEVAAALRVKLRKKRLLVRKADAWIAVWAHYHRAPVITKDTGDFPKMGVKTLRW